MKPHDDVLMHLTYSNCVPILAWGSEVKEFNDSQFHKLNTAVNSAIRSVFNCYWQTVSEIREGFGYSSLKELRHSSNSLVRLLYHYQLDCNL